MYVAGVGGPITGRGGDLLIIDDPIKNWQDANSITVRRQVIDWFNSTFYTRCEPGATIILVMNRWHEEDLTGYLLEKHTDNWEVISLPALAEKGDVLGRAVGEALCPARFSVEQLHNMRLAVGQAVWDALFRQRPRAIGRGRVYENYHSRLLHGIISSHAAHFDDILSRQRGQ